MNTQYKMLVRNITLFFRPNNKTIKAVKDSALSVQIEDIVSFKKIHTTPPHIWRRQNRSSTVNDILQSSINLRFYVDLSQIYVHDCCPIITIFDGFYVFISLLQTKLHYC